MESMNYGLGRRTASVLALTIGAAMIAASCGDDSSNASAATPSSAGAAPTSAVVVATTTPQTTIAATTSAPAPTTLASTSTTATPNNPAKDAAIAQRALLTAGDMGEGWTDVGSQFAYPISDKVVAAATSCAPFADVLATRNRAPQAGTLFARNTDIAFATVIIFPDEAAATRVLDVVGAPDFKQCWADIQEGAILELPIGVTASQLSPAQPPALDLPGDQSVLLATEGTMTIGGNQIPNTCVCAFVRSGRGIIEFHAPRPVLSAESRLEISRAAVKRLERELAAN